MASMTRKAIVQSFTRLLAERPFEKITVRDIVDDCGVTRNTFYYHFVDVYAVWEELLAQETERALTAVEHSGSWQEAFLEILRFVMENKKAAMHICSSSRRDELYRFLNESTGRVLSRYVEDKAEGARADDADKRLLVDFYRCALIGMFTEWVEGGMQGDFAGQLGRLDELLGGSIAAALCPGEEY